MSGALGDGTTVSASFCDLPSCARFIASAAVDYIRRHKGVWMTTGEEIYKWFKRGR